MKKNLFMVILFLILNTNIVHASCSLEEQVKINNAAGAVNAVASRLDYSYEDHDDDLNEDITTNGYTGIVYVYNLTRNLLNKHIKEWTKCDINLDQYLLNLLLLYNHNRSKKMKRLSLIRRQLRKAMVMKNGYELFFRVDC